MGRAAGSAASRRSCSRRGSTTAAGSGTRRITRSSPRAADDGAALENAIGRVRDRRGGPRRSRDRVVGRLVDLVPPRPPEDSMPADPDCLFCKIVAGDIPSTKVHEDDVIVAFRDIAPRAPTHILVIPRDHIASAADLTEADGPMLGRLFGTIAADRPQRGHRRRRLPARLERRPLGRPDRRPPPHPPARGTGVRVAARVTRPRRRGCRPGRCAAGPVPRRDAAWAPRAPARS